MQRDYRYTVYVLALAALVTLATVGITAGAGVSTSDPADASFSDTDFDIVDHDNALSDKEEDELIDLVRDIKPLQEHFDGVDTLQLEVHQMKALDDEEFVPIEDEYNVHLSPSDDDRLPRASLSVALDEDSLVIDDTVAAVDDVNVTVKDGGNLTDGETDQLTETLLDDGDVAYQIQTLLGEPDSVEITVADRDDDEVNAEVTSDGVSETVHATVDIDEKTVLSNHVKMQFDSTEQDDLNVTVVSPNSDAVDLTDESNETGTTSDEAGVDVVEEVEVEIVNNDSDLEDTGDKFTFEVNENDHEQTIEDDE